MELQSKQQSGEDSAKDPYDEVMARDKKKGYLPLYGRGVTKTKIKKNEKKSRYVLPDEFLEDIKANLTREVAQDIASLVLSQIKAVNPDMNLIIPDFGVTTRNQSSDPNGNQVDIHSPSEQQVLYLVHPSHSSISYSGFCFSVSSIVNNIATYYFSFDILY